METEQPREANGKGRTSSQNPDQFSTQPITANRIGQSRGRPPDRGRLSTSSSSRTTTSSRGQAIWPRRGPRTSVSTRAPPRTLDRALTLPEIPESQTPYTSASGKRPSLQAQRYQLRANRAPRYTCGTCGSRNCSCVKLVTDESLDNRLARGAAIPARELSIARAPKHPQHEVLAVQAQRRELEPPLSVQHVIITVEKTYASEEPGVVPPLEVTLKAMHETTPSDCSNYRFKEWTQHDQGGLEVILSAVIPPLPPPKTFGELDDRVGGLELIRCITAHQLWKKKIPRCFPSGRRIPAYPGLLVTSFDETTLVSPTTLLMCLESLRTVMQPEDTLCLHLADIYRGKFLSKHWLQLIAIVFCRHASMHVLDQQIYTPEKPITVTLDSARLVLHQHG